MAMTAYNLGPQDTPGYDSHFQTHTKHIANITDLYGPITQVTVAASGTLALTTAHHGATIILAGASATVTINATTLGDGFVCKIINDTGSDWTVPTPTGGTLRFDTSGNTKISAGGSGAIETYTRASTRYVHVVGSTA